MTMPPEWHPQRWLWVGFPHNLDEWPGYLGRAQEQIAAFASAVADSGQEVRLIVRDAANAARARQLCSAAVTLEVRRFGDVWLRDTGPLIVKAGGAPLWLHVRLEADGRLALRSALAAATPSWKERGVWSLSGSDAEQVRALEGLGKALHDAIGVRGLQARRAKPITTLRHACL